MTTNPQYAHFSEIFYPDGSCGVIDGAFDCRKPGVVLGADPLEPEPKTATWFCSEHWPEFEEIYSVVEDKRTKETTNGTGK